MFFTSYLVVKKGLFHHTSIAISKISEELSEVIFRIGNFARKQVILEDFIKPTQGMAFYHKTWPITATQLDQVLIHLNADRRYKSNSFFFLNLK